MGYKDIRKKLGRVRISGGCYRSQEIYTPGGGTHPMGERERIALFNMLGDKIRDARVLDAYAGGGTLGFEALSRGAKSVVFVEKNQRACEVIRQNSEKLKISDGISLFRGKVNEFLPTTTFDIIFMDPPYSEFEPHMIGESKNMLAGDGLLIVSHPGSSAEIEDLSIEKSRKYAGATITFYQQKI